MKNVKKQLVLLLSLAMLISMVVGATSVSADPTALLELDFSNLAATQAAPSATPNPSGVTATGSLAGSTGISFAERVPGTDTVDNNKVTKESIENANGGTTYFVKFFDPSIYPNHINLVNSWALHTKNTYITNADFESADNTISMWVDAVACSTGSDGYWKDILCYRVDYTDNEGAKVETFDLGINYNETWNALSAPREFVKNESEVIKDYNDGAFEVPVGLKHIVITNPKAVDGKKTMDVYVNGVFVKSVELDVAGTVNNATIHFFGNSFTNDEYWKSRADIVPEAKIGGFRIYDGVMSSDDVAALYNAQIAEFSDVNSEEIIGYSFAGDTVTYDGNSHNIEVTKAQGATEGVDIAYTCNGEAFTGATEIGTYNITATITKDGYQPLVLGATLKIKKEAAQASEGDLLIDLDFSTYVKDEEVVDPDSIEGSVGFVTNNGILKDTTVLKFKSAAMTNNWSNYHLDLESFTNSQGTSTYYLHKTVGDIASTDRNRFSSITESELEEQANTITFWLKYVPQKSPGVQYSIFDYYAVYGETGKHLFSVCQAGVPEGAAEGTCRLSDRGEALAFGDITGLTDQWIHVAIKNPEYALNPETGKFEKTMHLFINGEWRGQQTIEKPEGALDDVKIGLLGEITSTAGKRWPQDASIGGFKVFYGALTQAEINSKYNEELPLFNDVPASKLIEFVDGEGAAVESLNGLDAVTLKFTPANDNTILCFAACYDADGKLLAVKSIIGSEAATESIDIPDGTSFVKGYAWNASTLNPVQDKIELTYSEPV
ncbi:MAG: hypothetical protein J5590_00745 [Clostridia bacterium]|nr:hypothetical protein [Clostridia bacterium]